MNASTDVVEPPYPEPKGSHGYLLVVGFIFMILLLFIIIFVTHLCKRCQSPPPPPPDNSFETTFYGDADDRHLLRLSRGLDDDVLVTFPTFLYSEASVTNKGDITADANGSGCSICLADYKPADVVRLFPKCEHLFHVSCIDTWLKVHPTCPVCRNSPQPGNLSPL